MERDVPRDDLRNSIARLKAIITQSPEDREALDQIGLELEAVSLRLKWVHRSQWRLDERLGKIEQSLLFRIVRWPGVRYAQARNLMQCWLRRTDSQYQKWLAYERQSLLPGREVILGQISGFSKRPVISIALVVHEPNLTCLQQAIESVKSQIYSSWELCVYADYSTDSGTLAYLDELSRSGRAIRVIKGTSQCGDSTALNSACEQASGDYLGFLNQNDQMSPYALFYVAEALQWHSPAILYSDDDGLDVDGRRVDPRFKPAWSPELLLSGMYLSGLLVTSRRSLDEVGGFRSECDGAHDLDLCLRITENDERVMHIPRILYHRRAHDQPKAGGRFACMRAIEDASERRMRSARRHGEDSASDLRIKLEAEWLISIVICSRSPRLLNNVLKTVNATTSNANYEIIVAEHCPDGENPEMARIAKVHGCRRVAVNGPFNFSIINNAAGKLAHGNILLFLNDDVEPLRHDWLSGIRSHFQQERIGIVGAKLLYPSGAIQHAGVVVGIGDGAGHVNRHKYTGAYWKWVDQARDVSAVTGACLAIRTELFQCLEGFDPIFPNNYNDVDLCLRAREAGYRVIYEPSALLRHYEGQTRTLRVHYEEREKFFQRWHRIVESSDPYYSPNLSVEGEEAFLNFRATAGDLKAR